MKAHRVLRRWHTWLGWIVGLPFLLWTVSGLVMVARPIETVRGEDLLAKAPALANGLVPIPPALGPRPVASLKLEQRSEGPRWIVGYGDGASRLADAATGRLLPPLGPAQAARAVEARYAGTARLQAVDRVAADAPPIDFRRPIDAWRVTMSDGTRFYVHAATGEILAGRTGWWRVYDFMWGLHIMDLQTREDAHNPLLIGFAIASLLATVLALALLPLTIRRRKNRPAVRD
ncbi:MAG TPA: PepSY domain-containing protein [Allosphingosinicella sp.]|nr:PepSY domain-containing protein [Allosphingosinicella sp.]